MKYALIDWIHHNSCSIILASGVTDDRMFDDPARIGKVKCVLDGQKEPANGWKAYDARVIGSSGYIRILYDRCYAAYGRPCAYVTKFCAYGRPYAQWRRNQLKSRTAQQRAPPLPSPFLPSPLLLFPSPSSPLPSPSRPSP